MKIASWLIATILVAGANAQAGEVQVVFKVDAAKFKANLGAAAATVETKVAAELASQLQTCFPPFDWTTTPSTAGADATLTATLQQDALLIPNIYIAWTARVGNTDLPFHAPIELPIYKVTDYDRPYRSADRLVSDLTTNLKSWCSGDVVYKKLHDEFIRNVPLAKQVTVQSGQFVLIPLLWKKAKLGDKSEFRLDYQRTAPQSQMKVVLNRVGECEDGPGAGTTRGLLESCAAGGVPVTDDPWDKCVAIFAGQNAPPLWVSLENYDFDPNLPDMRGDGTSVAP